MSPEKKKWYEDLNVKSGYTIRVSFDKIALNETYEKKVDVIIAIDIVSLAYENAYDIAILVSGDGDFIPVVKKVTELEKKIELWAFRYSLSNALREELKPKDIYYLDDILSEIKM